MKDSHGISLCDSYCVGCIYHSISDNCCTYCFEEKNGLRGCPAGEGCDKRILGEYSGQQFRNYQKIIEKNDEYEEMRHRPVSIYDSQKYSKFMRLYEKGYSDPQIAKELNVNKSVVWHMRKKYDLPANYGFGGTMTKNNPQYKKGE